MSISSSEARQALHDISSAAERSLEFRGYRFGAPYFFLWGVIWIAGYGVTGIWPRMAVLWIPLVLAGIAGNLVIGRLWNREPAARRRMGGTTVALALFIFGTYAILRPHSQVQLDAFPALVVAMAYALVGIWSRRRYLLLGAGIFAATLFGYFFLTPWFSFWMAAAGGGGLILSGLWMRSA